MGNMIQLRDSTSGLCPGHTKHFYSRAISKLKFVTRPFPYSVRLVYSITRARDAGKKSRMRFWFRFINRIRSQVFFESATKREKNEHRNERLRKKISIAVEFTIRIAN